MAIVEELVMHSDGSYAPLTEGSTQPVMRRVTHAGLATVLQYDLRVPAVPQDTEFGRAISRVLRRG